METRMTNHSKRQGCSYLSWPIWLAYGVLFAIGIPWYWPKDDTTVWFGMPRWVVVAIGTSVLLSSWTAWLLRYTWPDEAGSSEMENAA